MILIAHRGNINGPSDRENQPEWIDNALIKGYDAEIDLWVLKGNYFLGHDEPQYQIDARWLNNRHRNLWVHCKNHEALDTLRAGFMPLNYFWHQRDRFTFTSHHYIWAYPDRTLEINGRGTIFVMPELEVKPDDPIFDRCNFCGICTDYIDQYDKVSSI